MTTYVTSAYNKLETPSGAIGEAPDPAGDFLHLRDQIDTRIGAAGAEFTTEATKAAIPTARCFIGKKCLATDSGIEYRWNGSIWRASNSDWISYTPTCTGFNGAQGASPGYISAGRYRYRAGRVFYEGHVTLNGGAAATTGQILVALPVNPDTTVSMSAVTGTSEGLDSSASTLWDIKPTISGTNLLPVEPSSSGAYVGVFGTTPFGAQWAVGDDLRWRIEYDPA